MLGELRAETIKRLAHVLVRSGTFRRELAVIDPLYDPAFLAVASVLDTAETDQEAVFARRLASAVRRRSSQLQDLWVLHETGDKRGGFFVEFGAADGLQLSSTHSLEKDYGWSGILAEPNPLWSDSLKVNRPGSRIDLRCVYRETGTTVPFAATRSPLLSTIADYSGSDGHSESRKDRTQIDVPTVSLNDLLRQHAAPKTIDYICIDTEGSEIAILENFDFGAWDVFLFCIEHNGAERKRQIDELMRSHGYECRFPAVSSVDGWYRKAP